MRFHVKYLDTLIGKNAKLEKSGNEPSSEESVDLDAPTTKNQGGIPRDFSQIQPAVISEVQQI